MTPTEAMADVLANYDIRGYGTDPHGEWLTPDDAAAAILAGLHGWTLVEDMAIEADKAILDACEGRDRPAAGDRGGGTARIAMARSGRVGADR